MGNDETVSEKPTEYICDLEESKRHELGNAAKEISAGYNKLREILIGDGFFGEIIQAHRSI
ncbi:MAG: hypothetical protein KAI18_01910 [Candidatus Aenigmarchaeota archaeon]|nr:hypothetical protein [Candidatus Aenigmarchaeota archaeon]